MSDVFRECRERVSALEAARRYGVEVTRNGKARCPFHRDRTPSLSFKGERFRCFGCGASGDAIDFTARLLGLEPMAAVERLNADFNLGLSLGRPPSREERELARRRREIADTRKQFETWKAQTLSMINAAYRMGHFALRDKPPDEWTDAEVLAVKWMPALEDWADALIGSTDEQMQVFRDREGVTRRCYRILNNTPMKSGVA